MGQKERSPGVNALRGATRAKLFEAGSLLGKLPPKPRARGVCVCDPR